MADNLSAVIDAIKEEGRKTQVVINADGEDTREVLVTGIQFTLESMADKLVEQFENSYKLMDENLKDQARKERLKGGVTPVKQKDDSVISGAKQYGAEVVEGANTFIGLFGSMSGLLTAFSALAAAGLGFRGNEGMYGKALSTFVTEKTQQLKNNILKNVFGLTEAEDGTRVKAGTGTSMVERVTKYFDDLKLSFYSSVGLGVDGKPVVKTSDTVKTAYKWTNIISDSFAKITSSLADVARPFETVAGSLADFFSGAGSKLWSYIKPLGESAGTFVSKIASILKPLGLVFSAWEAVTAWQETEGSFYDKTVAAIGAFIGDFFGAFFDLVKGAASWALESLGFDKAAAWLDSFSFEETISDSITGLGQWIKTAFTDPSLALEQAISSIFGTGGFVNWITDMISGVGDWILKKIGWREEDAPPLDIWGSVASMWESAKAYVVEKFLEFSSFVQGIPDAIRFSAEEMWIELGAKLKKGFLAFGGWLAGIPDRIKLIGLETLKSIPVVGRAVSDEDIAAARAAVESNTAINDQVLASIDTETQRQLTELRANMADAEAVRLAQLDLVKEQALRPQTQPVIVNNIDQSNRSINTQVGGTTAASVAVGGGGASSLSNGIPASPSIGG